MYKVGDKVRILHTDYQGEGLDVGTVHKVIWSPEDAVELGGTMNESLYFYNSEVEPYTEHSDHWKDIADALRAGIELAIENADYDRAIELGWKLDSLPSQ